MGLVGLAVCIAASAIGCKGESGTKASGKDDTKPKGAEPEVAPSKGPNFAQAFAFTEDKAKALFDRWLRAQNEGDFATYQSLFASRFGGVKRAGERVSRFSRDGWLSDRKRMFAKPSDCRRFGLGAEGGRWAFGCSFVALGSLADHVVA